MADRSYLFAGESAEPELRRLRLLESVFDEDTRRWVRSAASSLVSLRCLEVGAGAGSIATWMASEVGPDGKVVALDLDTRFLRDLPANVAVVQSSLGTSPNPAGRFDLAHARYVLIHNADARAVLRGMLAAVSPGGTIVVEEPDFSAAEALVGPPELKESFGKVREAIASVFASRGMTYALGRELPEIVRGEGATVDAIEYDAATARGGSPLARMMAQSAEALREKYLASGKVSAEDLSNYASFAASPDCWGLYYATVRIRARVE
jgi:2-polyprenyl-3-methyl-5-hydroxy-6-metoxy-1,4-benzoquinol methylase